MKKRTKFNQQLLNEELKKFKLLSEYDFYQEDKTPVYGYEEPNILILGNELEEAEGDDDAVAPDIEEKPGQEDTAPEDAPPADLGLDDTAPVDNAEEIDIEEPIEDNSNDVEIDVTSLVKGSEEAKASADKATQNTEALLQKLNDLESKIASMDAISNKINDLEKEIVKRNPTPVEKLEMRSLSSYPYSQKLTDFWADKEGQYDVMGNSEKKQEYVLTKDEIDTTYSEPEIKKSFGVNPSEYEEEEI